jgi:hypothetical protein
LEYIDNVTASGATTVPEPGSALLTLVGVGFVVARRRLKNLI